MSTPTNTGYYIPRTDRRCILPLAPWLDTSSQTFRAPIEPAHPDPLREYDDALLAAITQRTAAQKQPRSINARAVLAGCLIALIFVLMAVRGIGHASGDVQLPVIAPPEVSAPSTATPVLKA